MKNKILKLREEGKSYNEIKKELGCSKSTISFHCGVGQKEKTRNRLKKHRAKSNLINRVYLFTNRKVKNKKMRDASRDFQRRDLGVNKKIINKKKCFKVVDVLEKFGEETICYLSGENINLLKENHYCFDHIIPSTRGGSNELENLGILHKVVNKMKSNLTVDEFLYWCEKIYLHKIKNRI